MDLGPQNQRRERWDPRERNHMASPKLPERYHVYRHFDQGGRLLYVGCSLNPLCRLKVHKSMSSWFDRIARLEIERHPTKEAALAAEEQAVKIEKPEFNRNSRGAVGVQPAARATSISSRRGSDIASEFGPTVDAITSDGTEPRRKPKKRQ